MYMYVCMYVCIYIYLLPNLQSGGSHDQETCKYFFYLPLLLVVCSNRHLTLYIFLFSRLTNITTILTLQKRWKRIFVLLIFICGNDTVMTITRNRISVCFVFFVFPFIAFLFYIIPNPFRQYKKPFG